MSPGRIRKFVGRALFVLGLGIIADPCAAGGVVSGRVRIGKDPAGFADVRVSGTRRGMQTNEDGRFTITEVPAGRYVVRASLSGLTSVSDSITVKEGETTKVDLTFPPTSAR